MPHENAAVLEERLSNFDKFYEEMIPSLVEFMDRLGIRPAHEVLNQAVSYAPMVALALNEMEVTEGSDRVWLMARLGSFIGEYFAQTLKGCWFVNDINESRYFARYVVGRFSRNSRQYAMIDPFEIAQSYIDSDRPRDFLRFMAQVSEELKPE